MPCNVIRRRVLVISLSIKIQKHEPNHIIVFVMLNGPFIGISVYRITFNKYYGFKM